MQRLIECSRHRTATLIEVGPDCTYRSAPPVEIVCPLCTESRRNPSPRTGSETHDVITGSGYDDIVIRFPGDVLTSQERQEALVAQWRERQREQGKVIAGSPEEQSALYEIDSARADSVTHDHRPRSERGTRASRRLRALSYDVPARGWRA